MSKKKTKHYRSTPVVRTDSLDLDPSTKYEDLNWQLTHADQDYQALDDRCKYDAIARKVAYQMAEDATRNGFRLIIPGKADLQAQYQKGLDDLKVQDALTKQVGYEFKHGDGYMTYIVRETNPTDVFTPLDTDNIENLVALHVFGQNNVQGYRTNDDPTSDDYGKEDALKITPKHGTQTYDENGELSGQTENLKPIVINHTRYSHIALDKADGDETGTSMIKRCERQLNNMAIASETVGKMLREFTLKVFQSDRLMNEPLDKFRRDRAELSRIANTEAMMFTSNDDNIVKLATPTAGINVLLDFLWQDLSTACGIPKSVLTGEQSGTLAGAGTDVQNYYDRVKALQEQVLKPEIVKIVRLLMYSKQFAGGYLDPDNLDWSIEFNPLWTPDDKTQAEAENLKMQTAATAVQSGIYAPDEVRQKLDGEDNNQLQGMNKTDSADDIESRYTPDEIAQYEKDLGAAHNGTS